MSKILITGGAGFIGTHLCRALKKKGHDVFVLDIAEPRFPVDGVWYEKADVRNQAQLEKMLDGADAVYHFAAIVSVPLCQEMPAESHSVNLMATVNVCDAVMKESKKQKKPVRLAFAGSSVVYGSLSKENDPRKEQGPIAWPQSYYGAQKLGSEHVIDLYHRVHGLPAIVYRFFNVYGPGQDPKSPYTGVISIFSTKIMEGKPLQLHGGGHQTRDFVSVHDVARACAMALDVSERNCDGKAINLGFGKSVTIRHLAEEMTKVAGRQVFFEEAPARQGDVLHSLADVTRAKNILGWEPQVSLSEGLSELLRV